MRTVCAYVLWFPQRSAAEEIFRAEVDADDTGPEENWVYGMAAQIIDQATGDVRIYWPLWAQALP